MSAQAADGAALVAAAVQAAIREGAPRRTVAAVAAAVAGTVLPAARRATMSAASAKVQPPDAQRAAAREHEAGSSPEELLYSLRAVRSAQRRRKQERRRAAKQEEKAQAAAASQGDEANTQVPATPGQRGDQAMPASAVEQATSNERADEPTGDAFNFPAVAQESKQVPPYAPIRPSPRSSSQLEGRAGSPLPDGRSPHSASLLEGRSSSPLPAGRSVAASQLPQQEASMDVEHARVEGHGTAPSVAPASTPDPAAPMVGLTGAVDEPNTSALSSHALKQHVTNLLNGLDLQTVSLKTLRSMLEAHLKWPAGALEERKQDINAMVADFMHH